MIDLETLSNPLHETGRTHRSPDPCILVIFGATGDLTARRLVPALYNLAREGQLPSHFACVGFARREKSHAQFREEMKKGIETHSRVKPIDSQVWEDFSQLLFYHQANFTDSSGYLSLNKYLKELDEVLGTKGNRVYYLSTQPSFFPEITTQLKDQGLVYPYHPGKKPWSRIIFEKPFGHDLGSALSLQAHVEKTFREEQIYRIDHWLGKETVQNLLVFRFANSIFESLWNQKHIDHVQITVGEDIGVGTRGAFWEETGFLRDILQNHMMQLLCLVAMEPPANLNADSIRDEKVKVLQSIRPIPMDDFHSHVVRGQYGPGFIHGEAVKGYREEDNVPQESYQDTYTALQLYIDNWRWSGVPFYLRGGKRLPKRCTEIAISFKDAPGILFKGLSGGLGTNVLVIRIQPDEGISLKMNCKVPGLGPSSIQPVKMDFRYGAYFGVTPPEAYERLICDSMLGDRTLFARGDEVMESWKILNPILERWQEEVPQNFPNYAAGSWGPEAADHMLKQQGRCWRLV